MKYAILTFGCKVNQYESSALGSAMSARGFEPCAETAQADVIIINSCSVTGTADKKALHAVRAARRENAGAVIVLTGCFPQASPGAAAESGADIVSGTGQRSALPEIIENYIKTGRNGTDNLVSELPREYEEFRPCGTEPAGDRTRAFIKIEDGCDRYCSYCIIPYARGRVRSRSPEDIRAEAQDAAAKGHKETVLVGINLSRYGADNGYDLADAVNAAAEPEGIVRVRLSSLEPELMDSGMIAKLKAQEKLCPHFHLSLQSGCDETLRRMNRHYTSGEYYNIVQALREAFPGCSITTDIMAGFAGETDEEFEKSLSFAEKIGFARMHVFSYSVRNGTAAQKRTDHVPEDVKAVRYARMSALAAELSRRYLEGMTGKTVSVLIERQTDPEYIQGYAPDYTRVRIYGGGAERHEIVRVRIISAEEGYCTGEIV